MDKKMTIILVVAAVVAIAALVMVMQGAQPPPSGEQQIPSGQATTEDITQMRMDANSSSLALLESIIAGTGDNYTRERAVIAYADIALRTGNGEDALNFLKGVAYNEENDEVRTSAYTNYYWLKEGMGKGAQSEMDLEVSGELLTGNNITILVTASTTRQATDPAKISCGGQSPDAPSYSGGAQPGESVTLGGSTSGPGAFAHAQVQSPDLVRRDLSVGVPIDVPFTVYLKESGQTLVKCRVEVRHDRLDYDELEKWVYLDIGPENGTYTIR